MLSKTEFYREFRAIMGVEEKAVENPFGDCQVCGANAPTSFIFANDTSTLFVCWTCSHDWWVNFVFHSK